MRAGMGIVRTPGLLLNIIALLLSSLACVVILTSVLLGGRGQGIGGLGVDGIFVVAVLGGVFLFIAVIVTMMLRTIRSARELEARTASEVNLLRKDLQSAQAVIHAEPLSLITWEHGAPPRVVVNALPEVPQDPSQLVNFRAWLDAGSVQVFENSMQQLFATGQAFNHLLQTRTNKYIEADGRAAGRSAILKLRDVVGERTRLAETASQERRLDHEIDTNRALYDSIPMLVWFVDGTGRLEWVNTTYVRAVDERDRDTVLGRQIHLLEARQRKTVTDNLAGRPSYRERMHLIVSGERCAHDVVAVSLGRRTAFIATDASTLELAEGELQRQITSYDRTLNRVATAVATFGPDQRLTFHNEAYFRLWALDANWLATGPRDGEILDTLREQARLPAEPDYRQWKSRLLSCYRSTQPYEDWWHLPDGRAVHVVAEQRPDGGVSYLYDDVTERLALESRYNELIGVQSETLDHLREGVAVFATDGRLRIYNPAFAQIWKLGPADLDTEPHVEHVIGQCQILHDDVRAWGRIKRAVTALSDTRARVDGLMNRLDGSMIAYAALPLPDGATLLNFLDITDRKRVEQALIERNEALEAAGRLKNDFITHVSRELRTPLTNIIGFSELLASSRTGGLNAKQQEYLGDILASSGTLRTLVDDILDLAIIDAGAFELRLAEISAHEVIEAAIGTLRDRVERARLRLSVAIAPDVRTFIADRNRVVQMLFNLLSNAIGFSDQGNVIKLTCFVENHMILFSIEDQGHGIPVEDQDKIFERFESRSRGSKHRGAGLGLALVKRLVELHGGNISLKSQPGHGTTFVIRLPIAGVRRPVATDPVQDVKADLGRIAAA